MAWDLQEAVDYYRRQGAPGDQNALVNLLGEIQEEQDGIPAWMLPEVAEKLGTKENLLLALIRRIPRLRLADTHCLEICAGPNCPKRGDLAAAAEILGAGKPITLRFVPCMRQCGKGPNIRWDGRLYSGADEKLLKTLTER